jgi:hypothetical protein
VEAAIVFSPTINVSVVVDAAIDLSSTTNVSIVLVMTLGSSVASSILCSCSCFSLWVA